MKNNSKGIMKILVGAFCFTLGMTFASTDSLELAIIFFIICAVLIVIGIADFVPKENGKVNFSDQEKIDFAAMNRAAEQLYKAIKELSDAYMLGIPDDTIRKLAYSGESIEVFSQYVPSDYPTVPAFCMNVLNKGEEIINKMNLPVSIAGPLYEYCVKLASEMLNNLTEEDIIDIAEKSAKDLPKELFCLHTQINYETSALGIIGEYALKNADSTLIRKTNEYRRSRGFIQ